MSHKKKMEILKKIWKESSDYFKTKARLKEKERHLLSLNEYYSREKKTRHPIVRSGV
jgi:hypothetical protein